MKRIVFTVSSTLAALAAAEIVALEFEIGIAILSPPVTRVVLSLSYAFLVSWIFYLIVVYIPETWTHKHRSMVAARRMYHLYHSIEGILEDLHSDAKVDLPVTKQGISDSLDKLEDQLYGDYQEDILRHIRSLISQCFILSADIDPITLRKLDRIDFLLLSVSFGTRVEGLSLSKDLAEKLWEIHECISEVRKLNDAVFSKLENEIIGDRRRAVDENQDGST